MAVHLTFNDKIGYPDPLGEKPNPLTNEPYSNDYRQLASTWSTYPAYREADQVLKIIDQYQLMFVISGTGSGKSVMIPKLALHDTNYKGIIVMTLPKRIITLSAATFSARVSDVRLGDSIGYVYKGSDKKMLNDTNKLVYMTDGYLIMEFVRDPTLSKYNIIIMDEVHERNVRIDLLLLFLKKSLAIREKTRSESYSNECNNQWTTISKIFFRN